MAKYPNKLKTKKKMGGGRKHINPNIKLLKPMFKCSAYSLRSKRTFDLNLVSKERVLEELSLSRAGNFMCPVLQKKKEMPCWEKPTGNKYPEPIGTKGALSVNYKSSNILYVHQMYDNIVKIGKGSYGFVYKARSIETGEMCALKVIQRYNPMFKYAEIDRLDMVMNNPNCVHYQNAWEQLGNIYIEFELYPMSLHDFAAQKQITEEECWDILLDIVKALGSIHEIGYCHMDIKPENIMVTNSGFFKLADFGLLTRMTNMIVPQLHSEGDAKYIAENVLAGDVSAAGDVFALGISLLELSMDLILPSHGAYWHGLRDCSIRKIPDHRTGFISSELEVMLNWMMDSNAENRPTLAQITLYPKMIEQSKKNRVNHYMNWMNSREEDPLDQSPEILIPVIDITSDCEEEDNEGGTVKQSRRLSTSFQNMSVNDELVELDPEFQVPVSSLVTPRRRVSSVIICRSVQRKESNATSPVSNATSPVRNATSPVSNDSDVEFIG